MSVWSSIDREFLIENGISDPPPEVSDVVKKMTVDESSQYFIDRFGLSCTKDYVGTIHTSIFESGVEILVSLPLIVRLRASSILIPK